MKIKIAFVNEEARRVYSEVYGEGIKPATLVSAGLDLLCVKDITLTDCNDFTLAPLGVIIKPPEGYRVDLVPRSSLFKKKRILQANSYGVIDPDYCGSDDQLRFPALFHPDGEYSEEYIRIEAGERLCQILLTKNNVITEVEEFEPEDESRGGFGSSGGYKNS